jgi:AcrR family transcriptional regulator
MRSKTIARTWPWCSRVPRAKQRTPELRATLLQVAVSLLASEGVEGFTTRRVAEQACTSTPAVYELFGDRAGLVREMFFEGFRRLRARFAALSETDDPEADLLDAIYAFRSFARDRPELVQLMFTRPFADFDPDPKDLQAGASTREFVIGRVRRCVDAGVMSGDATDIAHVLLAACQGLAIQETAGWLGTSQKSRDRRWALAARVIIEGLRPSEP